MPRSTYYYYLKNMKKEDKYKERPSAAIGFKLNNFTGRVKYYEELQ